MVQIAISRGGEFKGAEADIVQGFVINAVCLISVLDQLMNGKCGIVWLKKVVSVKFSCSPWRGD